MARTPRAKKDAPLSCRIEGNQLIISIGISTLAFSANKGEDMCELFESGAIKIVNEKQFAKDVWYELGREDEDGSTMLTDLLDKAVREAVDRGSAGIEYTEAWENMQ